MPIVRISDRSSQGIGEDRQAKMRLTKPSDWHRGAGTEATAARQLPEGGGFLGLAFVVDTYGLVRVGVVPGLVVGQAGSQSLTVKEMFVRCPG